MTALIESDAVDYIAIEVIRGNAGRRWTALLQHLEYFVNEKGAELFRIGEKLEPVSLAEIRSIANFPGILIAFIEPPGSHLS